MATETKVTLEWTDASLRERESWNASFRGVRVRVFEKGDLWEWNIEGRAIKPACQPSLEDRDVEAVCNGRVKTKDQAMDAASLMAGPFIDWNLSREPRQ